MFGKFYVDTEGSNFVEIQLFYILDLYEKNDATQISFLDVGHL